MSNTKTRVGQKAWDHMFAFLADFPRQNREIDRRDEGLSSQEPAPNWRDPKSGQAQLDRAWASWMLEQMGIVLDETI